MKNKDPLTDFRFSDISDVRMELINNKEKFRDEKFRKLFLDFISKELDRCISNDNLVEQKNKFKSLLLRKRAGVILLFKLFEDYLFNEEKNRFELNLYLIFIIEVLYYIKHDTQHCYQDWLIRYILAPFNLKITVEENINIILNPVQKSNLELFRFCFGYTLRQVPIPALSEFLDYFKSQIKGNYPDFLEQIIELKVPFTDLLSSSAIKSIDNYIKNIQQTQSTENVKDSEKDKIKKPWEIKGGILIFDFKQIKVIQITRSLYKNKDKIQVFNSKKVNNSLLISLKANSNLESNHYNNIYKRLGEMLEGKMNTDDIRYTELPNELLNFINKLSY